MDGELPHESPEAQIASLLSQAHQGDAAAQNQLAEHCHGYLMAIARSELDPALRTKVAVSDIVQETLVRAQQAYGKFEGTNETELFAWLRRILLNHLTDVRRKYHGSVKRNLGRESGLEAALAAFDSATPGRAAIATEQIQRLRTAIEILPEDYRRVITLRNWECLSFAEIGEKMERSPDAVRMLWTRAVRQLGQTIGERDDGRSQTGP